jgi:hypothetical protein
VDLDEQSVVAIAVALPVVLFAAYLIGQHNAPRESITEMISQGESDRLEFKSSARWNLHTRQRDERIEMVIAKAVAAQLGAAIRGSATCS